MNADDLWVPGYLLGAVLVGSVTFLVWLHRDPPEDHSDVFTYATVASMVGLMWPFAVAAFFPVSPVLAVLGARWAWQRYTPGSGT